MEMQIPAALLDKWDVDLTAHRLPPTLMEALRRSRCCRLTRGDVEVMQTCKRDTSVPMKQSLSTLLNFICGNVRRYIWLHLQLCSGTYLSLLTNFTPTQPHSTTAFSKALCSDIFSSTYTRSVEQIICKDGVSFHFYADDAQMSWSIVCKTWMSTRIFITWHQDNLAWGSQPPLHIWRRSSVSQAQTSGELYLQTSALSPPQTHLRDVSRSIFVGSFRPHVSASVKSWELL